MQFENHDEFERWLEGQNQEVCAAIVCRVVMRVWPFVAADRSWIPGAKSRAQQEETVLLSSWCGILLTVSSMLPSADIERSIPKASVAVELRPLWRRVTILVSVLRSTLQMLPSW